MTFIISFLLLILHHHVELTQSPYSYNLSSNSPYLFCLTPSSLSPSEPKTLSRDLPSTRNSPNSSTQHSSYQWWSGALNGAADAGFNIRFKGIIKSTTRFPKYAATRTFRRSIRCGWACQCLCSVMTCIFYSWVFSFYDFHYLLLLFPWGGCLLFLLLGSCYYWVCLLLESINRKD